MRDCSKMVHNPQMKQELLLADPLSEFYLAMAILASILTSEITLTLRLMFGNCFRFFFEKLRLEVPTLLAKIQKLVYCGWFRNTANHLGSIYKTL